MRTSAKSVGEGRSRRSNVAGGLWLPFRVARVAVLDCCTADSLTGCLVPGRLNTYVLDDGEADRQLVFTAARRFCPAVVTPPMAATTPDIEMRSQVADRRPELGERRSQRAGLGLVLAARIGHERRQGCLDVVEISGDLTHHACPHVDVPEVVQRGTQSGGVSAQNRIRR